MNTLNVFVGANNTGKSTLLREINTAVAQGFISSNDSKWLDGGSIIVEGIKREIGRIFGEHGNLHNIDNYDSRDASELTGFRPFRINVKQNLRSYSLSSILATKAYDNDEVLEINLQKFDSANQISYTFEYYSLKFLADIGVIGEFCDSRLSGSYSVSVPNILQDNGDQSPIRYLRENPELMKSVSDNIKKVFDIEIGFDNVEHGYKPLRILPSRQIKKTKGMSDTDLAKLWNSLSPLIDSQGDGIKAYLKLALSLLDPYSSMIFIDEPETFLHPPQRRALGGLIADIAKQHNKQVFVSTHDPEFIRGILGEGSDVKVLNLKSLQGEHTLVELDLMDIKSILNMRGNVLKERASILNEAILNSLFYEKTILVESENDRFFYEYYSTLRHSALLQNKRFIGLRGKDEVLSLMEKLQTIGINVSCIVDIDFILDRAAPSYIRNANPNLHNRHTEIKQAFKKLDDAERNALRSKMRSEGIMGLVDKHKRELYANLIQDYAREGLYIVHKGTLESWLKVSKNNLSQMLRIIESRNPRELNKFMKVVLG